MSNSNLPRNNSTFLHNLLPRNFGFVQNDLKNVQILERKYKRWWKKKRRKVWINHFEMCLVFPTFYIKSVGICKSFEKGRPSERKLHGVCFIFTISKKVVFSLGARYIRLLDSFYWFYSEYTRTRYLHSILTSVGNFSGHTV